MARRIQTEADPQRLLAAITAAAVSDVAGADWAGISLFDRRGRTLVTRAATADRVVQVDRVQYEVQNGPCVESARSQRTVLSNDLAAEDRWPRFAGRAVGLGVRSILSLELFSERDRFGAMNLYSATPNVFDDLAEATGLLLAAHAALAMSHHQTRATMQHALDVRDVVGQAKGILMERFHIDNQQAFELLSLSSQNTNHKLVEVAEHLIDTGELYLPQVRRTCRTDCATLFGPGLSGRAFPSRSGSDPSARWQPFQLRSPGIAGRARRAGLPEGNPHG